jgi:hypothetical protein
MVNEQGNTEMNPIERKKKKSKSRAHFILFAENSPFMPKKERDPRVYNRSVKHRNRMTDEW